MPAWTAASAPARACRLSPLMHVVDGYCVPVQAACEAKCAGGFAAGNSAGAGAAPDARCKDGMYLTKRPRCIILVFDMSTIGSYPLTLKGLFPECPCAC